MNSSYACLCFLFLIQYVSCSPVTPTRQNHLGTGCICQKYSGPPFGPNQSWDGATVRRKVLLTAPTIRYLGRIFGSGSASKAYPVSDEVPEHMKVSTWLSNYRCTFIVNAWYCRLRSAFCPICATILSCQCDATEL